MHFKMSSAICFNLDKSKILSSGNELILMTIINSQEMNGLLGGRTSDFVFTRTSDFVFTRTSDFVFTSPQARTNADTDTKKLPKLAGFWSVRLKISERLFSTQREMNPATMFRQDSANLDGNRPCKS